MKIFCLFTAFFVLTLACQSDNPLGLGPGGCDGYAQDNEELLQHLGIISSAIQAYDTNPTDANCNSLKNAYQEFIFLIEDLYECHSGGISRAEFEEEVMEWEEEMESACD